MRCLGPGLLGVCLFASGVIAQQPSAAGVRGRAPSWPAVADWSPLASGCLATPTHDTLLVGSPVPASACAGPVPAAVPAAGAKPGAWSIPASALVPGSGQAILHSLRFIPYTSIEVLGWWRYAHHSGDARGQRNDYRDLAARVARAPFTSSGTPPVGDFDYYERMEHFEESGRFDVVPGGPLDPETDPLTYNGYVWRLARQTYWMPGVVPDTASTEYKQSIAFYRKRAYDGSFRWSWTNSPDELQRYRGLVHDSNESHRRAMQDLGLVIANHVLSTIDAFITVRVRRTRDSGGDGLALRASLPLATVFPR